MGLKGRRRGRTLPAVLLCLGCLGAVFGKSLGEALLPQPVLTADLLTIPAADSHLPEYRYEAPASEPTPSALPTTRVPAAGGGVTILNRTDYSVDIDALLNEPLTLRLQADAPQILIIHTHASESYAPEGADSYTASDPSRTEDTRCNMIRVGDALTDALTCQGFQVIHDRTLYDYPSYSGSYTRAMEAIQRHLEENPTLRLVLDIHRDAVLLEDGSYYRTTAGDSAQVMLCVGTDGSGLEHPDWRENLKLALRLQAAMCSLDPDLARPITLVNSRYNQHLTPGSLIVEIGYNGNTLQEALRAADHFADAAGEVLQTLF